MKTTLALTLLSLLFFVSIASSAHTRWHQLSSSYSFDDYLTEFGKKYSSEEYLQRKALFHQKLQSILLHNSNPSSSYKRGVNHLTDATPEEFRSLLGYKPDPTFSSSFLAKQYSRTYSPSSPHLTLPSRVDWRERGIITPVKDQGFCGSCWTFGTAETIEAHWALKTGQLTDLSEQQILDCTPNPNECGGTGGCNGGTAELAMARIIQLGGITTEWRYPYRSYFGDAYTCQLNEKNQSRPPFAKLRGYVKIASNQYEPLLQSIATEGPLAVSVDASSWSDYESGVYDGCNQTNPDIDHSVQLVGYGHDEKLNKDYWLVRNSWSPVWGEEGYIRLFRSPREGCGTDLTPSDGTGCKNGPPTVTVCGTCGIWYDSCYPIL